MQTLNSIVSMLDLDIKGAFDKVSKDRLLWVLKWEGISEWTTTYIKNFICQKKPRSTLLHTLVTEFRQKLEYFRALIYSRFYFSSIFQNILETCRKKIIGIWHLAL